VYNEAGMLKTKYLHSQINTQTQLFTNAFMQKIYYKYSLRGWQTGINDPGLSTAATDGDKFGMKLGYNHAPYRPYAKNGVSWFCFVVKHDRNIKQEKNSCFGFFSPPFIEEICLTVVFNMQCKHNNPEIFPYFAL
jgi:hypothetical protein